MLNSVSKLLFRHIMMMAVKIFRKRIRLSDPPSVIQIESAASCRTCRGLHHYPNAVTLKGISRSDSGWLARGVVTSCPMCGAAARAIREELPIVAEEFSCPKGHKSDQTEFQITQLIEREDGKDGYEFEARISCKVCKTKYALQQFKESLAGTSKIEVTSEGIKFK